MKSVLFFVVVVFLHGLLSQHFYYIKLIVACNI